METKIWFLGLFTAIGNVIADIRYASMHFGLKNNWTVTKHEEKFENKLNKPTQNGKRTKYISIQGTKRFTHVLFLSE